MSRLVSSADAVPFRETPIDAPAGAPPAIAAANFLTPEEAIRQAEEQAQGILDDAKAQAERILAEARAKVETLKQEARSAGADAGFAEGEAQGRAKYTDKVDALQGVISAIRADHTHLLEDLGPQVFGLVLAMVRRIVGEVVIVQPHVVVRIVRDALAALTSRSHVQVRVHPEDLPAVEDTRSMLFTLYQDLRDISFTGDPDVARGSCLIETPDVSVEATIDRALARLEAALHDAVVVAVDLPRADRGLDVDAVFDELQAAEELEEELRGEVDVNTAASVVKDALADSLRTPPTPIDAHDVDSTVAPPDDSDDTEAPA